MLIAMFDAPPWVIGLITIAGIYAISRVSAADSVIAEEEAAEEEAKRRANLGRVYKYDNKDHS
jgi:hypothetical protein